MIDSILYRNLYLKTIKQWIFMQIGIFKEVGLTSD